MLDTIYAFRHIVRQGLSCSRYSTLERDSQRQQYLLHERRRFSYAATEILGATGSWTPGNRNVVVHGSCDSVCCLLYTQTGHSA
jgi:hypothetical protein